ncbi:MAG: ATP synthase F1 subunit epsilon [Oscillospiraceae bacterium]
MNANSFHLEIITPDRQLFVGEIESLIIPALDGLLGVAVGHEPTVTAIEPGEIKYKVNGKWNTAVVSQGLAEIMPEYTMVLVASAERPEEIDILRAKAARERAEEHLRQKQSLQEYHNSKAALARAMARLKAKRSS